MQQAEFDPVVHVTPLDGARLLFCSCGHTRYSVAFAPSNFEDPTHVVRTRSEFDELYSDLLPARLGLRPLPRRVYWLSNARRAERAAQLEAFLIDTLRKQHAAPTTSMPVEDIIGEFLGLSSDEPTTPTLLRKNKGVLRRSQAPARASSNSDEPHSLLQAFVQTRSAYQKQTTVELTPVAMIDAAPHNASSPAADRVDELAPSAASWRKAGQAEVEVADSAQLQPMTSPVIDPTSSSVAPEMGAGQEVEIDAEPKLSDGELAQLSNKNLVRDYEWLAELLDSIVRGKVDKVADLAGGLSGAPIFVVAGGCPNAFCGMQARLRMCQIAQCGMPTCATLLVRKLRQMPAHAHA